MAIDQVDRTVVTQGPTAAGQETLRTHRRHQLTLLFRGLFAFALLAAGSFITTAPVVAATTIAPTTTCGMGLGDLGGRGLICEVTIVNTITASGGSAVVTVRECLGSAGSPIDGSGGGGFPCSTTTVVLTAPVTAVTQCNDSINGGGGTLRCSVIVTTNFVGVSPGATAVTVNQCVGSGSGGIVGSTINCAPTAATTSAAITQCNGSANGGTLVGLTCTATGTMASALPVTILQCQGSANGGGALVICSASITNNAVIAPTPSPTASSSPTPSPTASSSPTSSSTASSSPSPSSSASSLPTSSSSASSSPTSALTATPPASGTAGVPSSGVSTPLLALLICLALGCLGLAVTLAQRRTMRR